MSTSLRLRLCALTDLSQGRTEMKKLNTTLITASVLTALIALSAVPASADTFTSSSGLFGGFDRPNAGVPPTTLSGIIVPFNAQMFMVSLDGTYNFTLTALFN